MRSHTTWFVLLGLLCILAPYVLGVAPKARRQWFFIAVTITFLAWLLLLMAPVRSR
jgi:hypothetical protein